MNVTYLHSLPINIKEYWALWLINSITIENNILKEECGISIWLVYILICIKCALKYTSLGNKISCDLQIEALKNVCRNDSVKFFSIHKGVSLNLHTKYLESRKLFARDQQRVCEEAVGSYWNVLELNRLRGSLRLRLNIVNNTVSNN